MDPLTHALASYAAARAFLPRPSRTTLVAAVAAGTIADLDRAAILFGPSAWLRVQGAWLHSLPGALLLSAVLAAFFFLAGRKTKPRSQSPSFTVFFAAATIAAFLHVALDLCQSSGVALLWPFRARRTALDWAGDADPWILALLLAGLLVPALLRLVTEEIGAKDKGHRGRPGAVFALAALCAWLGARAVLHQRATALLDARTYRGELPLRVAALPENISPLAWHGIVETKSALHLLAVDIASGAVLDPDSAQHFYKPEPSPLLDAAQNTDSARRFLAVARFPKATVEKTRDGSRVELHDLRHPNANTGDRRAFAFVMFDAEGAITSQGISWEPASRR